MSKPPVLTDCRYRLDGKGGGREDADWTVDDGAGDWFHLNAALPETEDWLRGESGLDTHVVDGLLAEETRPRCDEYDDGVLVVLRGVNLNPGSDPEDMVSIRIWVEEKRIISTHLRHLMAVDDLRAQLARGKGPLSTGHFLARLAARLTDRMGGVLDDMVDQLADMEDKVISAEPDAGMNLRDMRRELNERRSTVISIRRYIAPQRDALNRLAQLDETWIDKRVRGRLRETVDQVTRLTEELDEMRERTALVQDELASRLSHRMERTMYLLTVVAAVMLPLGFITGLLGINVGGMPGTESKAAFWVVCALLAVVGLVEVWLFRKLKWL